VSPSASAEDLKRDWAVLWRGDPARARHRAQQRLLIADDPHIRVEARVLLAVADLTLGDDDDALRAIMRARAGAPSRVTALSLTGLEAFARLSAGDRDGAVRLTEELGHAGVLPGRARLFLLHLQALLAYFGRDHATVMRRLDEAQLIEEYDVDPIQQVFSQLLRASCMFGQPEVARLVSRAEPLARQLGGVWQDWWEVVGVLVDYNLGDWEAALRRIEAGTSRRSSMAALLEGLAATIAASRGDEDLARQHIEQARAAAPLRGIGRYFAGISLYAEAVVAELAGRTDLAVTFIREILDDDIGYSRESTVAGLGCRLVRMALAGDDRALAEELTACLERTGPETGPDVLLSRALLSSDVAAIEEARDALLAEGSSLEASWAEEELARLHCRAGRTSDARAAFASAHGRLRDLEATGELVRLEAGLRHEGLRLGARGPRSREDCGWDGLTPAEVRVAEFVAKGHTNPEIARCLHVSPRTVQSHVSRILGKLGLATRSEIAVVVARRA